MKTKSSHHKNENTFVFQSFSERIAAVNVDVIRRVERRSTAPGDSDTFFGEALQKWTELNLTEHFGNFRKEIQGQVQSLNQLVYHEESIVSALLKHLKVEKSMALQPLLDLVVQLARDLQLDFYKHFGKFFEVIVSLLNSYTQDVAVLEQAFLCLAYIFKFLWRYLVRDIKDVYKLFSPLLGDQYKEYMRNFAAESFAYLMRKVKDLSSLFDFMLAALQTSPDQVHGLGRLLFEMLRGVKSKFHSCTEKVLPILLGKLDPRSEVEGSDCQHYEQVFTVLSRMSESMIKFTSRENTDVVWSVLLEQTKKVSSVVSSIKKQQRMLAHAWLDHQLKLLLIWVSHGSGSLVKSPSSLAEAVNDLLRTKGLPESCITVTLDVVAAMLSSPHYRLTSDQISTFVASLFKTTASCSCLLGFFRKVFAVGSFEACLLPPLLNYCHEVCLKNKQQTMEEVLYFMTDLILHKTGVESDAADISAWHKYKLDFGMAFKGRSYKHTFPSYVTGKVQTRPEDLGSEGAISTVWGVLVCLPNIQPVHQETVVSDLRSLLTALVKHCAETSPPCESLLVLVRQSVICLKLMTSYEEFFRCIPLDLIKSLVRSFPENVDVLFSADVYFTSASLSGRSDALTPDVLESLFPHLQCNVSSPSSLIRRLTLRILNQFSLPLQKVDYLPSNRDDVFKLCLDAELVPVSVQESRDKLMYLRKLEYDAVQNYLPIGPFNGVPLRYLLSMLYVNFTMLWSPVMELVQSHAYGMDTAVFWSVFSEYLEKATGKTEKLAVQSSRKTRQTTILASQPLVPGVHSLVDLMHHSSLSSLNKEPPTDIRNFRQLLWKAMQLFPDKCEARSRLLSPLIFRFLKNEYYTSDLNMAQHQDISADNTVARVDASDLELDNPLNEEDMSLLQLDREIPEGAEGDISGKRYRKAATKTFVQMLSLFAKFKNPKSTYLEPRLHGLYYDLLHHQDPAVQKVALQCLMTYNYKFLVPYKENFDRLLDDKTFKNEIALFSIDPENGVVLDEHREGLLPVLMRVLYGKMLTKTGNDTAGKGRSEVRRGIVFRFLAGSREEELKLFLDLIFQPFMDYVTEDISSKVREIMSVDRIDRVIPLRKQHGVLNSVDVVFKKLGNLIDCYLPTILRILVCQAAEFNLLLRLRDQVHPKAVNTLKALRQLAINRIIQFFSSFSSYPFSPTELEAILHAAVWPQVDKLSYEGLYHPTPLLKLFNVWSHDSRYFLLLSTRKSPQDVSVLHPVFTLLLANNVHLNVVSTIMEMVDNLLTIPDFSAEEQKRRELVLPQALLSSSIENESLSVGTKLLLPHVSDILRHIRGVVKSLSGQSVKKHNFPARELNILSKISVFVKEPETSCELIRLLLPFLSKNVSRSSEVELDILRAVSNLMKLADNPEQFLGVLSPLFGSIQDKRSRTLLCDILQVVAARDSKHMFLAEVVLKLNSWDKRRVEEPDYILRLEAFQDIKDKLQYVDETSAVLLRMIVYNCCFFINNIDDMSLRDSSSFCVQEVIRIISTREALYKPVVTDTILAEIRAGLRHKLDSPRQEFLSLLSVLVHQFPSAPVFSELYCLIDADAEADFFENLKHIQTHRRARALRRLNKHLSGHTMKSDILVSYLLPIATAFLLDETYSKVQNLVDASIETISAVCSRLPWNKYVNVLRKYLLQLTKMMENQKVVVRIVVGILDAFHFDLSAADVLPAVPQAVSLEEIKEQDDKDVEMDADNDSAGDLPMETEPSVGGSAADEPDSMSADEKIKCSPALAARISRVILEHIMPRLHKCLIQKSKSEGEHKLVKSHVIEDSEILRVPIALAMVKLLQNFPSGTLSYTLPGILLKVCQFLKSRAKDIRDVARDTLSKILDALGPSYFSFIVKELRGSLTRGYQLHVLCFTVHMLLKNMSAALKPGDLDSSLKSLIQIYNEELFGNVAEEKEVAGIVSKLAEAKSSKSYDAYHVIASFISQSSLSTLVVPLKEALDSTHSHKVAKKVQEVLKRISFGLLENKGLSVESLMVFVHGLTTETMPFLNATEESKPEKTDIPKAGARPPSTYLLKKDLPRGKSKPKMSSKTNMHMMVEFGLHILNSLLKQSKVNLTDPSHLGMLDPFVDILNTCMQSKYVRIASTSLRCLAWLLRTSLPSLKESILKVTSNLFVLLRNYAVAGVTKGDNFELVVLCFKAVTVLVRDVKYHSIDTSQLQVLLTYVEADILDTNKQATAFGLLKAILSRKLMVTEIHDLMKKVANLSVTAESSHVRLQCRQVVLIYMLDYPLGKKLRHLLEFYISQLPYEHETGRESVLEMMATLFSSFPQNLLLENAGLFFVPLAAQLINDESVRCKKLTALAIKSLLEKLDNERRDQLFSVVLVWFKEDKVAHKRLAAHVCGLFAEVESVKFERHLVDVLPVIESEMEPVKYEQVSEDTATVRGSDHMLYQVLTALLKITRECNLTRSSKHVEVMNRIWSHVHAHLLHPHIWVRLTASQLFGLLFSSWSADDVVSLSKDSANQQSESDYLLCDTKQKFRDLSASFIRQLQSPVLEQELADQIIKNLVYSAKLVFTATKKNSFSETDTKHPLTIEWLIKKLCREATFEASQNQKASLKRSSVFKWMAAVAMEMGSEDLPDYLPLFLPPLLRESTNSAPTADSTLKTLAQEVLDIMKGLVGVEMFTKTYSQVHKSMFDKREARKQDKAVEAVSNPEVAARKKIKKNLAKKEAKKRKIMEFKPSKKVKKRRLQDFAIVE